MMSPPPATMAEYVSRVPAEQRVIVHNVSWVTYESLLADLANQSTIRMAYDRGTLEIMSPLPEHERYNRTIAILIEILAEELEVDVDDLGSTTFKREDLARGFEPDSCFYVQHEAHIRGRSSIDLTVDPPPDLVIEVDMTSGSLNKFPLYTQIGVPEIWRYDGQRVRMYTLMTEGYIETETSRAFPLLTGTVLAGFLQQSRTLPRTALLRAFRAWVRAQRSHEQSP
jgi:Uma2 family endonuclease